MVESATWSPASAQEDIEFFDWPGRSLVQVSSLTAALRRRRRIWLATTLAGLVAAVAFFLVRSPQYQAKTTVLLRRGTINSQDPARAMETDVQLAQSRTVVGRARTELHLREPLRRFQSEVKATSASDDILQITVKGSSPADAIHRADVVARTFLAFRGEGFQRETDIQVAALQQERDALQAQAGPLDDQINAATSEAGGRTTASSSTAIGDLLARRSQISAQIATLQQRMNDLTANSTVVTKNSQVVDPAVAAHRSIVKALGLVVLVGLLGGLAVGAGWVLVGEATSNRVRRRYDFMTALDAPVRVSVGALGPRRHRFGSLLPILRGRPASPPLSWARDLAKVARHLRDVMAATESRLPMLAVVSIDSDDSAGLAIAATVKGLLDDGTDVLAVDLSATSALARVFGVGGDVVTQIDPREGAAKLWVVSKALAVDSTIGDWLQIHNLRDQTEAVVLLANLDPAEGARHLAALASTAVVVVTSGRSTATALRATSQMLKEAGVRLDSAVLVEADPTDESFGVSTPPSVPAAHLAAGTVARAER